jgi:hypothetical protein
MKFQSLSNQKLYLNTTQHQIYTIQKIKKLSQKWSNDLKSNKISIHTFKKLLDTHFDNLVEIPKYEIIQNKKHSTQCSYAIEHSCHCWCEGQYHGKMITQEITQ